MSSLWYFIGVLASSRKVIKQVKALLRNYLWAGREYRARARVAWKTCILKYKVGGLSLTDPDDATNCLLSKWVLRACEPGNFNLLKFLRYCLLQYQPTKAGNWGPDLNWCMAQNHKRAPGSKIWLQIGKAWQKVVKALHWKRPQTFEATCNVGLWYSPELMEVTRSIVPPLRTAEICFTKIVCAA